MQCLKFTVIILLLFVKINFETFANRPLSKEVLFRKHSGSTEDTSILNSYIRKALPYKYLEKDPEYFKANIDTAEQICLDRNIEFPSLLYLARAEYFLLTNDIRSASQEGSMALNKAKTENDNYVTALVLNFMGRYSIRTHFYMESISYFENCIQVARKDRMRGILPRTYFRLATVYDSTALNKLAEFRKTMESMIEASYSEKDTTLMILGLWFLGSSLTGNEPEFNRADSLLRKCLYLAYLRKDSIYMSRAILNLGWKFCNQHVYDSAIKYYNKALTYSIPARLYGNSDNAYGNLGTIYRDLGDNDRALKYYEKAIEQAKLADDLYALRWINKDMSTMYLNRKDTGNAYLSFVLFKKYDDMFIGKNNSQVLADERLRYEAESHNKEVELLSLKLYNQRLLIYGSLGLFGLSVAVLILLLSRSKINAKRKISEMNRKIAEVTQANFRQQMNPHFIFNTLNSIQYYMYQHDKLATNNYLTKFSSLMRKVLENSQHTSVPLRDELDALKLYLELEMIRFKDKFEYRINVDEEIDTLLYKVPTMLIQPYVENSITHGLLPRDRKGYVKIDLKLNEDFLLCTIEDNGIGRKAALERKNQKEDNHNSLGTQIISSRLELVNALYGTSLKTVYTDLKNEEGEPAGTRVEIQIPILS